MHSQPLFYLWNQIPLVKKQGQILFSCLVLSTIVPQKQPISAYNLTKYLASCKPLGWSHYLSALQTSRHLDFSYLCTSAKVHPTQLLQPFSKISACINCTLHLAYLKQNLKNSSL